MGVFHIFKIVQIVQEVPNRAKHHIYLIIFSQLHMKGLKSQ